MASALNVPEASGEIPRISSAKSRKVAKVSTDESKNPQDSSDDDIFYEKKEHRKSSCRVSISSVNERGAMVSVLDKRQVKSSPITCSSSLSRIRFSISSISPSRDSIVHIDDSILSLLDVRMCRSINKDSAVNPNVMLTQLADLWSLQHSGSYRANATVGRNSGANAEQNLRILRELYPFSVCLRLE